MSKDQAPLYMPEGEARLWQALLTLTQELSVARDRIDLLERRLATHGVLSPGEADNEVLDASALSARAAERSALVSRIFKALDARPQSVEADQGV